MNVGERGRGKLRSGFAGATLVLLLTLIIPRSVPVELFRQLSPVLVSAEPVSQRHLVPLGRSEELRQRIWVSERGLVRLTFFAVGDAPSEPPHLRLREDRHGAPGLLLAEAYASARPGDRAHELIFSFAPLVVERQWVWAEIASADPADLPLAREVSGRVYPGGHIVLAEAAGERTLPGVLAFVSFVREPRWPASLIVVLLGSLALAAWSLMLAPARVDSARLSR